MSTTTTVQSILDRVLSGERMSADECTLLLESHDVARMGVAADEIRARRHPNDIVTYIIDRNVNYTSARFTVAPVLPTPTCARWRKSAQRSTKLLHSAAPAF